jgi:hypothetical protein
MIGMMGSQIPETLQIKKAFEDAEQKRPGAQEALSGLAAAYENPGEAPETPLPEGMQSLIDMVPDAAVKGQGGNYEGGSDFKVPGMGEWQGAGGWQGALSGALTGVNIGGGTDAGKMYMQSVQDQQRQSLERRQQAWGDAYEMAKKLPPEILTDPQYSELAQAAAAFQKDMQDGQVDNEKTLSTFLTQMAMHRQGLAGIEQQATISREMEGQEQQQKLQDAQRQQRVEELKAVIADPSLASVYGIDPTQAEAEMGQLMASADQFTQVDGKTVPIEVAEQLRQGVASREHYAAQDAAAARRIELQEQELALMRSQWEQARASGDAFAMLSAYNSTIQSSLQNALSLIQPDMRDAMGPGEREQMQQDAIMQSLEKDSKMLMETAQAAGTIKPGVGTEGDEVIIVEGVGPMEYPSDETLAQLRQAGEQAAAEAQQLAAHEQQATSATDPAGQMTPGGMGGNPGLVEGQRARYSGDVPGMLTTQTQIAQQKIQELDAAYQELLVKRSEVHMAVAQANQRKAMMIK